MKCKFIIIVWSEISPIYYALVGKSFFGVTGLLVCHRWLWMVIASTLADKVLAGMWLNCFLSELYLYSPSIIFFVIDLGPIPVNLLISSVSGQYVYRDLNWQPESRNKIKKLLASDFSISLKKKKRKSQYEVCTFRIITVILNFFSIRAETSVQLFLLKHLIFNHYSFLSKFRNRKYTCVQMCPKDLPVLKWVSVIPKCIEDWSND